MRCASGPRALVVRSSSRIVVDDDDAVARQMHVELETVSASARPLSNADIVFSGPERRAAAMRVDERPAVLGTTVRTL